MGLNELLYLTSIIPPIFLVIFILFMAFKKPQIVGKSTKDASDIRPNYKPQVQALLGMFYALDELRHKKEYRLIYVIGVIGTIGTAILLILLIFMTLPTYLSILKDKY